MKSLIFKLKWMFRIRMMNPTDSVAVIVDTFEDNETGNDALNIYKEYIKSGKKAFILCAFNKAPMGKYLNDIRDIYIFNNDPEILLSFCLKKGIKALHFVDKDIITNAAHAFGFSTVYSLNKDTDFSAFLAAHGAMDKIIVSEKYRANRDNVKVFEK